MKRIASLGLAVVAALTIAACTRTGAIYNLKDVPVATASGKSPQPAQVRAAIITAGTSLGWRVTDAGPGKLEGTLVLRGHTAVVDIPYSAQAYSVSYKRSENLNEANGTIHSNYNGWVQNLDKAIRTEISRL